ETDLVELNPMLQAYANMDVNRGTMGLYAEMATSEGAFTGYVKPIIKDLDVLGSEDRNESFFHKLYEGVVGTAGAILTNPREEQVATKVELKGELKDVRTSTLYALVQLILNAFIQALVPALDQEISLNSLGEVQEEDERGFFQQLFDKQEKEESGKEKGTP